MTDVPVGSLGLDLRLLKAIYENEFQEVMHMHALDLCCTLRNGGGGGCFRARAPL